MSNPKSSEMSKILIVKHPSGMKRTVQFNCSASFADVLTAVSQKFNLNRNAHELKLGPKLLNLNDTIGVSSIPETVVLDIAPKSTSTSKTESDVLVQMGFSDEGCLYESRKEVMKDGQTLWDAVEVLVPSHMAYTDEDICVTYLGVSYRGKERLRTVKLVDLCGAERRLFFMCRRNYLQRPYSRKARGKPILAGVRDEKKRKKTLNKSTQAEPCDLEPQSSKTKSRLLPRRSVSIEDQINLPTLGNSNPGVVELSDRLGRLYHGKCVSAFAMPSDVSRASLDLWLRAHEDVNRIWVRIAFPNGSVLEGRFALDETIEDVEVFVKKYIVEEAHEFYLYTVQPKLIVNPGNHIRSMRSTPPGTLWYAGKFKGELFKKDLIASLEGNVFSYASSDIPEESKYDLCATSSTYFWSVK